MAEPSPRLQAVARAGLAARWLDLGRPLDILSLGLTLLACAGLLWPPPIPAAAPALGVAIAAGLAQKVYALRVAFDRGIFADWARRWEHPDFPAPASDLAAFDDALDALGLRRAGGIPQRSLEGRIGGALGLMKRQAACLFLQVLALAAAAHHGY